MTKNDSTSDRGDLSIEKLTRDVGNQVRSIRSRRGLTRKILASQSEVSERYLARLEQGTANISMALLWRIANALGIRIGSLLPVQEKENIKYAPLGELIETLSTEMQVQAFQLLNDNLTKTPVKSCRGVALIGLRGGGKSTLGKRLSDHFEVPFINLHDKISTLAGMEMGELILLTGQSSYRRLELQALQQSMHDHPQAVIETGGSLISEAETYRLLRDNFFTVWVRALPDDHMSRVIKQGDMRPIVSSNKAMDDLKLILKEREDDYRLADFHIMTSGHTIDESFTELLKVCSHCMNEQKSN